MKNGILFAAFLTLPFLAHAQNQPESPLYIRFGLGASVVENIEGFENDALNPQFNFELSLDPGVRIDVAPGFSLNRFVAVELNTGFIWNGFEAIEADPGIANLDGDLLQIPILGNLVLQYPTEFEITPFVGVGGGGVYARMNIDEIGSTEVNDSSDDFFAACQVFAGIQYSIQENLSVGAVYKYLHVFSEEENSYPGGQRNGLGDLVTHSIGAAITLNF